MCTCARTLLHAADLHDAGGALRISNGLGHSVEDYCRQSNEDGDRVCSNELGRICNPGCHTTGEVVQSLDRRPK